jgi:hypothetical protein
MLLDGAKEAYELSFVTVPAQPRASTRKSIGFCKEVDIVDDTPEINTISEKTDARILALRVKNAESFFNTEKSESEE